MMAMLFYKYYPMQYYKPQNYRSFSTAFKLKPYNRHSFYSKYYNIKKSYSLYRKLIFWCQTELKKQYLRDLTKI